MPAIELEKKNAGSIEALEATLLDAGALALKTFRGVNKHWNKGNASPVSEVDLAVNALLHERLDRSDAGWLSEESTDDPARLEHSRVWIVDPIDGTRAYLAGYPDWSISVALVEDGRPILAGLFAPAEERMFLARAGHGTTLNGERVRADRGDSLSGARVAGPRSYQGRLAVEVPDIVKMEKVHSLALRFARVAQGEAEVAMASVNAHDWDLAAADLLVHEAGGALTGIAGRPPVYNRPDPVHGALLAAGTARHEALLALVRDKWTDLA